ncbi:serine/threonine-protein kinase [Streptomyces sp. NPDC006739]|uniref:serine/threonine-protein kinase n=1 Tax=Streptomyces sp. NPDC006739 TaxID=3364763 RepID=UPI003687E884
MLVAGRYRLVESIGQGGMGRVWRAVDEILDRLVAVKEMRVDGLDAEDSRTRRERALREARATARIDHPHVVRVYDVVDEGERLWIVMELVVGRSLEQITAEDGPLDPHRTAHLGLGLVAALRQVHAGGVLHRDIKPGNVLVEHGGSRVVLTDFGIAAIQDAKALTMVGMLVGSPDYMAPERVSGRPQGPPSDVWSLGATLCAALAGHSPFSRDTTLATLHAVLYEEPELPSAAGPLRPVLAALLQKDPAARPPLPGIEQALRDMAEAPRRGAAEAEKERERERERGRGRERERGKAPRPRVTPDPAGTGAATAAAPPPVGPAVSLARSRTQAEAETQAGTRPASPDAAGTAARPRRRTALLAALGVVAVAAVVAVLLGTSAGGPRTRNDAGTAGSTGPSTAPASTAPSPTVEGTARPPGLPPGARREAGGFAWVTPRGWRRDEKTGAEVHYTSPDGRQELAAKSSLARGDLMDTWRTSEQNAHQGEDYVKIRLGPTTFHGHPAVLWEYTFTLGGVPWHARLLGFDANGKSYQINTWYRPEIETQALKTYSTVKETFTVL